MLLLVMAILMPYGGAWAQTPSRPSIGDGSADKPYKISTAAELAWFRDQVNSGYTTISATLTKDIDLAEFCHAKDGTKYTKEVSWTPIGNSDNIENMYQGTFDGNGKTIRNLYINDISEYIGIPCEAGFFGYAEKGSIKNITFDNAKVKTTADDYRTGILVGVAGSCIENIKILANCSVEGKNYVGGIVGRANGDIGNCENHAMVNGANFVGGIVGNYVFSDKSITSCANYGVITGSGESVGGIAGYFVSGTILNCANYGDITGTFYVGNLIGCADECNLNNVLGTGNVTATSADRAGLLVGNIDNSSSTASGILAYNSSAKLTINGTEQTGDAVKAIGGGSLTSAEKIMAFTAEQLKSGMVANLLQKNVSGSAKWGQKLNTDDYPLLGSADEVYLDGNVTTNCLGEQVSAFTNTKPAQEGTLTVKHGDSPIHHESVAATCTTDGNIEYWECNLCHKSFSDKLLTQGVSTLVVSATGHKYGENDKCTMCQKEIPSLTLGNNLITIEKTYGSRDEISGYNLYKYTAPEDGRLEVTANSNDNKTCGTLWESPTAASRLTYDDSSNWPDFKITYTVTKGTTYYIGARKLDGNAIEGEVKLNVKMNGLEGELPTGMTGKGTEAEPFELKTADHLAWFRDFVNEGNMKACAKIADDVKEIDMSTVCHKADTEKQVAELSWTPIGNFAGNKYQGTFDGNGKTISNLYIINAASSSVGFFGYAEKGSFKNITFDNAKVKSTVDHYTGILAGFGELCIIENIKTLANCSVEGKNGVGGIAGMASGDIGNCENHAMVNGANGVGGIVGDYRGSGKSIISCANYGVVTGTGNCVGGIAGGYGSGTIQNCANYGDITGADIVGNLIGDGSICNLNNVLGTGNVIATSDTERAGLLVGRIINSSSTASGILAYNSSSKLTINKIEQTGNAVKAIGKGSLTYPEKIKAFTAEQLNSGEVAYLLNGSKSEGELVWYQKLGTDAYPVLVAEEGNTVYHGSFTCCDGTAASYSNSTSENELVHVASATLTSPVFDSAKHIYHMGCSNESCPEHKYAANADGTLKATKADGKFYVEKLALTDASTAINTQAQFTVKKLQYSRQLTEGQTGYVTLCLPFDIKAADVAGAEKCYPVGDMMIHMPTADASVLKFVLMLDEQSVIKAGTPMIVKLAAENAAQKLVATAQNVEYNANFFANPTAKSLTLRDWDGKSGFMTICHELTNASIGGVYTTTPMAEGSYSFRADGKFGIHTGDLSPYRIYLNVQPSQSASSRTMLFSIGLPDDSSTTGIRIISLGDGKQTGSSAIYTLEGQRVMGTPRKGIYIKNGKKFSVK
ncbi:hypothetical protein DWV76_02460 [Segatella copri]|uniref:Uncharacterized protein n=2 Tax=Segatella copri TaxID=165179 RepID=A0AA92TZ95_9BACT|nr:hypothetical protein DWV76_02460 [Segatella copri]